MKKYEEPTMEVIEIDGDVITASTCSNGVMDIELPPLAS